MDEHRLITSFFLVKLENFNVSECFTVEAGYNYEVGCYYVSKFEESKGYEEELNDPDELLEFSSESGIVTISIGVIGCIYS